MAGNKAFLGFPSVTLLGQYVDGLGVSIADNKLATIRALSFPKIVGDLEIYLGIIG